MTATWQTRTVMLLGPEVQQALRRTRVIIFGVGGVGSWCAESLARTGVGHITLVDADDVVETNINRQLHAMHSTVGRAKVEEMRRRLLDVNPEIDVEVQKKFYDATTADDFDLSHFDYVIDAIDTFESKTLLIRRAAQSTCTFFSSMGAALKTDPSRIAVADFWAVNGCPLGKKLRKTLRAEKSTIGHFACVYSDELLSNHDAGEVVAAGEKKPNGSLVHITAIFGLRLSALVVNHVREKV